MYTHRYVRSRLVEDNPRDRYDLKRNLCRLYHPYPSTHSHDHQKQYLPDIQEYWTNGKTTLLHVPVEASTTPKGTIVSYFGKGPGNKMTIRDDASSNCPCNDNDCFSRPAATTAAATSSSNNSNTNNVVRNSLVAGSAAGMASTIACHPFDVLRVKMQSSAPLAAASSGSATATTVSQTTSLGAWGTLRSTLQFGGVRALYTGLALPLAAQAVYKSTIFTVNNLTESFIIEWNTQEQYKLGKFHEEPYRLTMMDRFVSGFMGGAVNAALFCTPVEYVRNQQIAQMGKSGGDGEGVAVMKNTKATSKSILHRTTGPCAVIRQTIHSNGVSGLWRGLVSTVLRDSVGCGFFFVAMAQSQALLTSRDHDGEPQNPTTTTVIVSGAAAGVAYWLWALPIDTCKTWIQSGTAANLTHAVQMSQREGFVQSIPSLFRGWQLAYTRGAPSAAITVTIYSFAIQYLQQQT